MNFFRIIILSLLLILGTAKIIFADSHDSSVEASVTSEINEEELPLNDPFAGDEGTSTQNLSSSAMEEKEDPMSLYNFKLVGIISGEYESFVSLVNADGEVVTVSLHEELSEGVKLVDMRLTEAIFENGEKYLVINFKNQIMEKDEY